MDLTYLRFPTCLRTTADAHSKWLLLVKEAQDLAEEDARTQKRRKFRIKERFLAPEVIGRLYAQYCVLINKLYDTYLNSIHLQRATYMLEIVSVFIKRMYELRDELVHLIVNDYVYVDSALVLSKLTPPDIQIIVPYHFPLESREDGVESMLQRMWAESYKRKNKPPKKEKEKKKEPSVIVFDEDTDGPRPAPAQPAESEESLSDEEETPEPSEHTVIPEEYIQAAIIQCHERFRQYFMRDFQLKCKRRKNYFADKIKEPPRKWRIKAAALIQMAYRKFMQLKREHVIQHKRDVLLGIVPDPFRRRLKYDEEANKVYEMRRQKRMELQNVYARDMERENTRLLLFKKDFQIDDITEHVKEWFKEWFYGYGFFPQYPYEVEGGTIMVIREDYPTIEEKQYEDERYAQLTKGKTKDQLKNEKMQAAADAEIAAELAKEAAKKEAMNLFKARCVPDSDPGYEIKLSDVLPNIIEALQKYRAAWSILDSFTAEQNPEIVYGYIKPLLTEDLMSQIHIDARKYVDEFMRLDLKLLIKCHEIMFKNVGKKFPKVPPRKRPKSPPIPKPFNVDKDLLKGLEELFDLNIITKPTTKIKDIYGDSTYAAYDYNIRDPDAKFPPPGYGDIIRRLLISCVFGIGVDPGATRRKSVMILGPPRQGKSFLVDAVAGELNAVKIDISPEKFSSLLKKPGKTLVKVFQAARVFQPAVIYMRNVERVFQKKIPPAERYLKAKSLKKMLEKLIKAISVDDKVIFIGTCSLPLVAKKKPMVSCFNEILLVPRTDYGTLQQYFYQKLQSIRSIPRDMKVTGLAQILQGYGFGVVIEMFDRILSSERIVRLNAKPLHPSEFLEYLIENELEPLTLQDYEVYTNFYLSCSPINAERQEYEVINRYREAFYTKMEQKKKADEKAKANG